MREHFAHEVRKRLARQIGTRDPARPVGRDCVVRHRGNIDHELERKMREHVGDDAGTAPPIRRDLPKPRSELHAARKVRRAFPWGETDPSSGNTNLFENGFWSVAPIGAFPEGANAYGCHQMIGDVWEWTTSDYVPYPGFKSEFDEYNDKWFVNQKVLRGGSFATPQLHIRTTYRNFFHAHERWMTSGFRCAASD